MRHAAPWRRKISASSSFGRNMFGPSSRLGVAGQVEGLEKMALHPRVTLSLHPPRARAPPPARAATRPPPADPAARRATGPLGISRALKKRHYNRLLLRARGERPRRRAAEERDELAAFHHEEFPTRRLGEYRGRWDRKLAYSPEVAQAEIMPSNQGPDVRSWHKADVNEPAVPAQNSKTTENLGVLRPVAISSWACSRRHGGDAQFSRLSQRFGVLSMDRACAQFRAWRCGETALWPPTS
jgi:hypothetical protein